MEQPSIPPNQSLINSSNMQRPLSGIEFFALLLKHKLFLLITTFAGGIIALGITMTFPNWYEATVNFVPPNNPQSGMSSMLGNVSSALKDFGLGKIGSKGEAYSYIVILQSRTFQDSLITRFDLAKEYELPDSMKDEVRAGLKKNMEISYLPDGNYTITFASTNPQKAADMANYSVEIANTIALNLQKQEASVNRIYMEQRLKNADSTLSRIGDSLKAFAKINQVFSPLDQAKALTTALAEMKAGVIKQEILVHTYKNAYGEDDPSTKLQKQNLDELRSQVYKAEHESGFGGNFAMTDAMDVGVPYMRLFTDFEAMSKVKAFLLPMLEQARLDEFRKSPTMYVLDAAVPATKKARPKRSLIAGGAALGVFILGSIFILVRYRLSTLSN
ncbi:MAG: hypothetical protein IPM69_17585 [Ignavibacteria bacterium]|nr:hypothetical protein [Ignavibacteria bacterium]